MAKKVSFPDKMTATDRVNRSWNGSISDETSSSPNEMVHGTRKVHRLVPNRIIKVRKSNRNKIYSFKESVSIDQRKSFPEFSSTHSSAFSMVKKDVKESNPVFVDTCRRCESAPPSISQESMEEPPSPPQRFDLTFTPSPPLNDDQTRVKRKIPDPPIIAPNAKHPPLPFGTGAAEPMLIFAEDVIKKV